MQKKAIVIGSGFSGLAAAAVLAKNGIAVDIYEKNSSAGGRARKYVHQGYTFDMGPTWYWLPDVFEKFFAYFGKKPSDFYQLQRLDPSYRAYFGKDDIIDIPAGEKKISEVFDAIEPGSGNKLRKFLKAAKFKYHLGMEKIVHRPAYSVIEFIRWDILTGFMRVRSLASLSKILRKKFKNKKLLQILEFPVIFLGSTAKKTPSLYSLMNYADMGLGTWYPTKGMYSVVDAMVRLCTELGVNIHYNAPVTRIITENNQVVGIEANNELFHADAIIASADYQHTEQQLLPPHLRNYSEKYWENRDMAPSALIYYIGVNKKLDKLAHHNLFFDTAFDKHAYQIYEKPSWPDEPALYVSVASKTDASCAPNGHENLIVLIPVSPGLHDTEAIRKKYLDIAIQRIENISNETLKEHVIFSRSYAQSDFIADYNSYKGNAYGLANTLRQTGFLKPKMRNRKLKNMFYAGQLTTPGPGVPPSIISGMVSAKELLKIINH